MSPPAIKYLIVNKFIVEPESKHIKGLTLLDLSFDFEGHPVEFNADREGVHPQWADRLVSWLKLALGEKDQP